MVLTLMKHRTTPRDFEFFRFPDRELRHGMCLIKG